MIPSTIDTPAINGQPVTQAHTDLCAASGHLRYVIAGVDQEMCPRCGEVTAPAALRVIEGTRYTQAADRDQSADFAAALGTANPLMHLHGLGYDCSSARVRTIVDAAPAVRSTPCPACGRAIGWNGHPYSPCSAITWRPTAQELEALPLDLLTIPTPRGTLRHLVSVDEAAARTLCGRQHGVNPRYIVIGGSAPCLGPADAVTCRRCFEAAQ